MKKNRMVAWSAVAGFVLSFGIGLFSSVPFGVVLLRAVIAAGAFGMLGIAIRFVFARFIADASEGGDAVETDGGAPVRTVGAAVDITLPDEELPREEHASQFYVGSQHPMLNEGEYGAAARASSPRQEPSPSAQQEHTVPQKPASAVSAETADGGVDHLDFVPGFPVAAENEASLSERPQPDTAVSSHSHTADDELDELPDMDSIKIDDTVDTMDTGDDDDDFSPRHVSAASGASVTEGADTVLMARAISTVLADE